MDRTGALYDRQLEVIKRYFYKVNSGGIGGDHVNKPDNQYRHDATVEIIFKNNKLDRVEMNFELEDCSSPQFWYEIQAAVADQVKVLLEKNDD